MEISRRHVLRVPAAVAALAAGSRLARAQSYPTRPITMIVPFPAGGATDTLARLLSEPLRASLGQPVIIENVAGAAGSIGVGRAVRAASDGYTLSIGTLDHACADPAALYPLQFDLLADLAPIAELGYEPLLIVGRRTRLPVKDLKELIAWLKANPDKATVGIPASAPTGNLAGICLPEDDRNALSSSCPIAATGRPCRISSAGQIDMMIEPSSNFVAQVRANTRQCTCRHRQDASSAECRTCRRWTKRAARLLRLDLVRLWAPKDTPKDMIDKLNAATVAALADPDRQGQARQARPASVVRDQQTPEALAALQKSEADKWWPIIKAANIKGE